MSTAKKLRVKNIALSIAGLASILYIAFVIIF